MSFLIFLMRVKHFLPFFGFVLRVLSSLLVFKQSPKQLIFKPDIFFYEGKDVQLMIISIKQLSSYFLKARDHQEAGKFQSFKKINISRACYYFNTMILIYNIYLLIVSESGMQDQKQTKKKYRLKSKNGSGNQSVVSFNSTVKGKRQETSEHFQVHDLQTFIKKQEKSIKEYPFQYNFNEYLRLFLIKVLPPKEKDIKIDAKEKKMKGPQNLCEPFLVKIKQEFAAFSMKVIKFKAEADIQEIQFQLQKSFDIKIFKKKYMQLTVKDIMKTYGQAEDAQNFLGKLASGQLILVRIKKICQIQCLKNMNELISKCTVSTPRPRLNASQSFITLPSQRSQPIVYFQRKEESEPSASNSSSSEELIEDNEQTYYQSQSFKKSSVSSDQNYSMRNNIAAKKPNANISLSESFIDDSISVRGAKMKTKVEPENESSRISLNFKKQEKKENQEKPQYQIIKKYEYQNFDERQFLKWLKNQKKIRRQNIIIQSQTDPYADNDEQYKTYKIKLVRLPEDEFQNLDIQETLELYLKFRKVIMINIKNTKYKQEIIKQYVKEEQGLQIKYISGYKSPKWAEAQMWKHIIKNEYSKDKKAGNSEYFQLFFIQGVKNVVQDLQRQLKDKLNNEPKDDSLEDLMVQLPSIADYLRGNSSYIKNIVLDYFKEMIKSNFNHCCYLQIAEIVLGKVKLELRVKCDQMNLFEASVRAKITERAQKQVKITDYSTPIKIDQMIGDRLSKIIPLISRQQKAIKFVSTIYNVQKYLQELSKFFNDLTKIGEKQIKIKDKMIFNNIEKNFDGYLLSNSSFTDIKKTIVSEQMKIKLYGSQHLIGQLQNLINSSIAELQASKINYYQIVKEKQAEMLKENDFLDEINKKYDIWINVQKEQLPCKIIINNPLQTQKRKTILYIKSKSLNYAPFGSVIAFRSHAQIQLYKKDCFLKTFKNYISKSNKHDIFQQQTRKLKLLLKNNSSAGEIVKEALGVNPNPSNCIVLIAPQKNKKLYFKEIIDILQNKENESRQVTVMIFEYGQATIAQEAVGMEQYVKGKKLRLKDQTIYKYYVQDKGAKFFYSQSGNKKIDAARQKGFEKIILNNEDLNITHLSHRFDAATLSLIHHQSNKKFPVFFQHPYNIIQFEINKIKYDVPIDQSAMILQCIKTTQGSVNLSLGVYEIDLKNMTQKNMFSDYSRQLCKQQTIIKANLNEEHIQVFYSLKMAKIQYSYTLDKSLTANLQSAVYQLTTFLSKKEISKDVYFQDFGSINFSSLQNIKSTIEQDEYTQCFFNQIDKKISFKTLDQITAKRCEKMITLLLTSSKEKDSIKIDYPLAWTPQKTDIQTFQVAPNSPEFLDVQAKFTCSKIKTLIRIQNKIIFNKYYEEKKFLENMTGKPIKTMQLFHGTRTINPQEIYRDKEQSFNINYSSDNNLLGKGIYFAEKSQYSNDYRHQELIAKSLFSSTSIYSMFLCQVLVGESQKCPGHSGAIKDTSYRDPANKIRYESMTDFLNNSNIFVVYKSRRAYPLYLIKY